MNKSIILKILLILLLFKYSKEDNCNFMKRNVKISFSTLKPIEDGFKYGYLEFKYFSLFSQINLNCFKNNSIILFSMVFYPNRKLILDSSFSLLVEEETNSRLRLDSQVSVQLIDLKGIDIQSSVFSSLNSNLYNLEIFFSHLNLYNNSVLYKKCLDSNSIQGPLQNVLLLTFTFSVKYSLNTCPLIFKNTRIQKLNFYGFSQIFVKNNMLGFIQEANFENLNSQIENLCVYFYNANLNKKFLNIFIFQNTQAIFLYGVLNSIESDAFKHLTKTKLWLSINNFDRLIYTNFLNQFSFLNQTFL